MSEKNEELRMNAYYYSFEPTGVIEIDHILSAVACAGKSYHNTDQWNNKDNGGKESCVEFIQRRADEAAKVMIAERGKNEQD